MSGFDEFLREIEKEQLKDHLLKDAKQKKGLDKYDTPYNQWTNISDDVVGLMFVFPTKNLTVSYGDYWDGDGFMVTTDKDPYYLESDSKKVIKTFKKLPEAKKFAYKLVEDKLK